jgi:hypothetical protein
LSKKGIAKTLRGHFFELFCCLSAIKKIHHFLTYFRALSNEILYSRGKEGTRAPQKPRTMGHTLYQKNLHRESKKGTSSDTEAQRERK